MSTYLRSIRHELAGRRILQPLVLASAAMRPLGEAVASFFPDVALTPMDEANLMGRDVLLVHSGEQGWDELLEEVCQQSPGRLFVIAPECPRAESAKLEWIADMVLVGRETHSYEVHDMVYDLGLSA